MEMNKLKLLGTRASSYMNRVEVLLNLKSIDYELIQENLLDKSELLLKSNPIHKKIPVLIHGDNPICESQIIIEYIEDVWTNGPSVLPSDPYERANDRFWAAYLDQKWFPAVRELRIAQGAESKAAVIEKIFEGIILMEDVLIKCSKGKEFFGGDEIGCLDIVFGCFLGWLKVAEIMEKAKFLDEAKTPRLVTWSAQLLSHKAIENLVPKGEELLELLKSYQEKLAAASAST